MIRPSLSKWSGESPSSWSGGHKKKWSARTGGSAAAPFTNAKSMVFDGVNEAIDLGVNYQFERTTPWSFSAWLKPTATNVVIVSNQQAAAPYPGWDMNYSGNKFCIELISVYPTSQLFVETSSTFSTGSWYHVVGTYDGSSTPGGCKIYVNGTSQSLTTVANNLTTSILNGKKLWLGTHNGGGYWPGHMDEPSLWDRVLTGTEVTELYNSGAPGNLATHSAYANLLSWWRMGDEDDDITDIEDRKGAIHGTPTNMEAGDIVTVVPP